MRTTEPDPVLRLPASPTREIQAKRGRRDQDTEPSQTHGCGGRHLASTYLGPVALLSHDLSFLLQQSVRELLCLPGLLRLLLCLPVRLPGLQLALCNLGTKEKALPLSRRGAGSPRCAGGRQPRDNDGRYWKWKENLGLAKVTW